MDLRHEDRPSSLHLDPAREEEGRPDLVPECIIHLSGAGARQACRKRVQYLKPIGVAQVAGHDIFGHPRDILSTRWRRERLNRKRECPDALRDQFQRDPREALFGILRRKGLSQNTKRRQTGGEGRQRTCAGATRGCHARPRVTGPWTKPTRPKSSDHSRNPLVVKVN